MPNMIPFAPLFAKGRQYQQTVVAFGVSGNGLGFVNCSANVANITAGMPIFVSNTDGSFPEYVGKATSVAGTFLNFQLQSQWTRAGGGLVWTPASYWQSSLPGVGRRDQVFESGIERVETSGKVPLRTKTAEERELVRFAFERLIRYEWATYLIWMRSTVGGRLGAWTCAWYDYDQGLTRCAKVIDNRPERALERGTEAYALRSWACELAVVADLTYY